MSGNTILATKLHRPPLPEGWISRPLLFERLTEGLSADRPLTLVSAPAGFGKSTCVSGWIDSLADMPSAWLSLDPSDDDPGRFFPYFIAALQNIDKTLGRDISGLLCAGELPSADNIAAVLTDDILSLNAPFIMVLDDLHHIRDPLIHRTLERLLLAPPPQIRMIFLTREDPPLPLARLRANGRLTEIRAADLRFTNRDAELFLNRTMNLSLSENDIAVLEEKTEGWAAGLQLAAIALRGADFSRGEKSPSAFISSLSGSHRYIGTYLTEQVLERLPEDIRAFLLRTSILDELTAGACDAVSCRDDSGELLERLNAENLFLVPLDDRGRCYRYHHLFADILRDLRNSSMKNQTAELHRRACRWYRQEGIHESAIEHALAGEDYAAALEMLETHSAELLMRGHVRTLDTWIHALPPDRESRSPRINLAFAWMHILRGSARRAEPYLKRLGEIFDLSPQAENENSHNDSLRGEWLVIQALIAYGLGEMEKSLALAQKSLATTDPENHRVSSLACYAQASAYCALEEYSPAERAFQESIQKARRVDNRIAEILSTAGLSIMAFEHGRLLQAVRIAASTVERMERAGYIPSMSCVLYGALAEVDYQWYRLEEARRYMLKALRLSTLGGYAGVIGCRVYLSRLDLLEGKVDQAAKSVQEAVDLIEEDTPGFIVREAAAQKVRVHLAEGNLPEAERELLPYGFGFRPSFSCPGITPGGTFSYSSGLLYNSSLHVILYRAEILGDSSAVPEGLLLAEILLEEAVRNNSALTAMETLLLRARLRVRQQPSVGNDRRVLETEARKDIIRALRLGEPEGIAGVFIEQGEAIRNFLQELKKGPLPKGVSREYIERLLSISPPVRSIGKKPLSPPADPAAAESAGIAESLTDRELEVLACMARGMKYRETADHLFVSLNTVRFHVKSIYGKLAVDTRMKAIEKARAAGLLR